MSYGPTYILERPKEFFRKNFRKILNVLGINYVISDHWLLVLNHQCARDEIRPGGLIGGPPLCFVFCAFVLYLDRGCRFEIIMSLVATTLQYIHPCRPTDSPSPPHVPNQL